MLIGLIIGFYLCGFVVAFASTLFFCMLGGRNSDLWMPFVFAIAWPLILMICVVELMARRS